MDKGSERSRKGSVAPARAEQSGWPRRLRGGGTAVSSLPLSSLFSLITSSSPLVFPLSALPLPLPSFSPLPLLFSASRGGGTEEHHQESGAHRRGSCGPPARPDRRRPAKIHDEQHCTVQDRGKAVTRAAAGQGKAGTKAAAGQAKGHLVHDPIARNVSLRDLLEDTVPT